METTQKQPVDTISIFFYAEWCNPCKRVKPLYFEKIRGIYAMNGISTFEYNYDENSTKELMGKFGVKTIPTLCVIDLKRTCTNPFDLEEDNIIRMITMDSHGIEKDWANGTLLFTTEEDF